MGGHNYVPHKLHTLIHTLMDPLVLNSPQIHTLPFHNVIISFSMVSFFTKPRGMWGTVRVELAQATTAQPSASEGLFVPSETLAEEPETEKWTKPRRLWKTMMCKSVHHQREQLLSLFGQLNLFFFFKKTDLRFVCFCLFWSRLIYCFSVQLCFMIKHVSWTQNFFFHPHCVL